MLAKRDPQDYTEVVDEVFQALEQICKDIGYPAYIAIEGQTIALDTPESYFQRSLIGNSKDLPQNYEKLADGILDSFQGFESDMNTEYYNSLLHRGLYVGGSRRKLKCPRFQMYLTVAIVGSDQWIDYFLANLLNFILSDFVRYIPPKEPTNEYGLYKIVLQVFEVLSPQAVILSLYNMLKIPSMKKRTNNGHTISFFTKQRKELRLIAVKG